MFTILCVCFLSFRCSTFGEEWNEMPLQDFRIVRDDSKEANNSASNLLTENPFLGRNSHEDFSWLDDTIKDAAYYLRSHKFNEFDRRYETKPDVAAREYFAMFPRPPLRALHWEVQEFCDSSFLSCMKYVKRKLKDVALKRMDDTSLVIQEQKWTNSNNSEQIKEVNEECVRMREKDDQLADPFQGPIERFQWRTTASYYLCWYTMNEVPDLRHFNESCDNYAYCLNEDFGEKNRDYRAEDSEPFACATYSFCPDPCCPMIKHSYYPDSCDDNEGNPCYEANPPGRRRCKFNRSENRNFHDIILNRWNVSCNCTEVGFKWSSRYGLCIDVNECAGSTHGCDNITEICVNLKGSHLCACRWGYEWNYEENKCTENGALAIIKKEQKVEDETKNHTMARSLIRRLIDKIASLKSRSQKVIYSSTSLNLVFILTFVYSNKLQNTYISCFFHIH